VFDWKFVSNSNVDSGRHKREMEWFGLSMRMPVFISASNFLIYYAWRFQGSSKVCTNSSLNTSS
jgi:hypothetical protein